MSDLPIEALRASLVEAVANHRQIILSAPTGSGKSTQVPQMLLDEGLVPNGQIVILQPRRIAARLLARRVAQERHVSLGAEVGYQIRFEDLSGPSTRIKYETEGILLRQLAGDPMLSHVGAILFDEFHERHLQADLMLAQALRLQQTHRPDLLLVVMSATLELTALEDYLKHSMTLTAEGRTYPVDIKYLSEPVHPRHETIMDVAAREAARLVSRGEPGDILIFMPGAYEIRQTIRLLQSSNVTKNCIILPLHGELPPQEQDAAVSQYDQRKIIVSTNVAETSLTIDGVRIVIDSGRARIPRFDPHRSINTLFIEKISQASAAQRAGRAGRTAPGTCVRCWTEKEHRELPLHEVPEIKRLDLSESMLNLIAAGNTDVAAFPWFERPSAKQLEQALQLLADLGALDDRGNITALGTKMATFPLHPRYARMLLTAEHYQCVRQMALIAALTQERPILIRQVGTGIRRERDRMLGEQVISDFFIHMRAWSFASTARYNPQRCRPLGIHAGSARQVTPIYEAFLRAAEKAGLAINDRPPDDEAIAKCILAGFADQVAKRRDSGTLDCLMVHGRKGQLQRDSSVHDAPLLVASEMDEIQMGGQVRVLLGLITRIEKTWLHELFPEAIKQNEITYYDAGSKRVLKEEATCYHDLVLESKITGEPNAHEAATCLADAIKKGLFSLNKWDNQIDQWIARVNFLAKHCPELGITSFGEGERDLLFEQLCLGCTSQKEVRDQPIWPTLRAFFNDTQKRALDAYAPEKLELGLKRPHRLIYGEGEIPYFAARIQELFGLMRLPTIAMNRITPLVHVLAPNQRPVQITQDLSNFWDIYYPQIRKELCRKYPKHAWPENPRSI